jgi:hypothetical protein
MRCIFQIGRIFGGVAISPLMVTVGLAIGLAAAFLALLTLPFALGYELLAERVREARLGRRELDELQLEFPGVPRSELLNARRERLLRERDLSMQSSESCLASRDQRGSLLADEDGGRRG